MDPILYRPGDLSPTDLDARGRHPDGRPYGHRPHHRVPMRLRAAQPRAATRGFFRNMVDWFTP